MNPDQTLPRELSDLGPYNLQYRPPTNIYYAGERADNKS